MNRDLEAAERREAGQPARMNPHRTTKRQLPPKALGAEVTDVRDLYVIGHLGIAHIPAQDWTLRVTGQVRRGVELDLAGLLALPSVEVTAVLECFGNPLHPDVPTRRVGNVVWRGVPVAALLDQAGADPDATLLWAEGRDHGTFEGYECTEYRKDLPLDVVRERGILAYEMNGEPLTDEHGFPVRLFVPGYFGTNNVKWLRSLTVASHRAEHLFTTHFYQRRLPGSDRLTPVRDLDVNSLITSAEAHGDTVRVAGWAWGRHEVTEVQVGLDECWQPARLDPRPAGSHRWQGFSAVLRAAPGEHTVRALARDAVGRQQPLSGARNQCPSVAVTVAGV